jgi:hypothetical protein
VAAANGILCQLDTNVSIIDRHYHNGHLSASRMRQKALVVDDRLYTQVVPQLPALCGKDDQAAAKEMILD